MLGKELVNNQGLKMKVIRYKNRKDIDVEFEDGYIAYNKRMTQFESGGLRNPNFRSSQVINRVGEENKNNQGVNMKIIRYETNLDIDVEFDGGYIAQNKTYANFKIGNIYDPTYYKRIRVGEEVEQRNGGMARIIGYRENSDIDILFLNTGNIIYNCSYSNFSRGTIKDDKAEIIFDVGCTDGLSTTTKCAKLWYGMMARCYYNGGHPAYKNVEVCDEWKHLENFKKWFDENYYEIKGTRMELDKDILCHNLNIDNKMYSPKTCMFIPSKINSLITSNSRRDKTSLPRGVHFDDGKYYGCFRRKWSEAKDNIVDAFLWYKSEKEKYLKELVEEYKDVMPNTVYENILKYEVRIDDK